MAAEDTSHSNLTVVDLRKSFTAPNGDRLEVLRGIDLSVGRGESVAIVGASGSGKSTLLHLLGCLDTPDHGSVRLDNVESQLLNHRKAAAFRRKQIGFVFQFHYLLADLTAEENVAMPLLIARLQKNVALTRARQMLQSVGLEDRHDYPVFQLSGGEQQRIAVARALVHQPLLLLADEPTGNLDTVIGREVGKRLIDYGRESGGMAIIATHSDSVAQLCDRVLELRDGRIQR